MRTADTWANRVRVLSQQFQQFASIVGEVLINVFKPLVSALNSIMSAVINFARTVADALGAIFGWTISIDNGGITNDLEVGTGEISDNLGEADSNAKKLKRTLLSFDQIHMLNGEDEGDSGGGGSDLSGLGGGAETSLVQVDNVLDKYKSEIENLYQLGEYIGKALTDAMNSIDWDSVYEGARNFGTGLANFLNGLISPDLFGATGRTIASALNTAIYAALSFGQTFDFQDLGLSIATGINNFFTTFDFGALADTIDVWVQGIWDTIKSAVSNIDWSAVWEAAVDFLGNLDLKTVSIVIGAVLIKKILSMKIASTVLSGVAQGISSQIASAIATHLGVELSTSAGISGALLSAGKSMGTTLVAGIKALLGSEAAASALAFINPIIKGITGIGAIVGGAATAVTNFFAMWENGFSWLNEALMGLGTALAAVGAVILGAPATVAAVVAGIVTAVGTLAVVIHDNWEAIVEFFTSIPERIGQVWDSVTEYATEKWNALIDFFKGIPDAIGNVIKSISDWFSQLPKKVSEIVSSVVEWFNTLPGKIGDALGYALGTVTKWGVNVFSYLSQKIPETINAVSKWFSEIPGKIGNWLNQALSRLQQWGANLLSSATNTAQNVFNAIITWFQKLPSNIASWLSNTLSRVSQWGSNLVSTAHSAVQNMFNAIVNTLSELPSRMWNIGENLVRGLWDGINGAVGWLKNKVSDFCNGVIGGFMRGFDEHSPSKKAYEIGDYFTQGLQNGLVERFSDIYSDINEFTRNLTSMDVQAPQLDLDFAYNMDDYKPKSFSGNSALSGAIYEEVDASMAQYAYELNRQNALLERIEQAIYNKELRIGDKEVFDSWKRQDAREYRRTGAPTPAGIV